MIIVDLEGKPIAVNSRDADGKPINTNYIYEQNFASKTWFKETKSGQFLKGEGCDGTHVEDAHIDETVKRLIGGNGLAISYTAPIYDNNGKPIAIWHNKVSFDLVNQIYQDYYDTLNASGIISAELTLIDKKGRVLVDLDPSKNNGRNEANTDTKTILSLNLAK